MNIIKRSSGKIRFAVIGSGQRGQTYSKHICEQAGQAEIVAVVEPDEHRRNIFAQRYSIPGNMIFDNYRCFFQKSRLADTVVISTPDDSHYKPAILAAEKGYNILLEKPLAQTLNECMEITKSVKKHNIYFNIFHVLRYAPVWRKVKEIINSGQIGDICAVHHIEGICWWHYAHSFIRGNWRRSETSPIILAKGCHDIDLINWWVGLKCSKVASFGSLKHFTGEHKPEGAADRCLNCKYGNNGCPYSAKKFYYDRLSRGLHNWPLNVVITEFTPEALDKALRDGPYGRCVYKCDNSQMDTQHTIFAYENGVTAELTLSAFTPPGRYSKILATQGYIECNGEIVRTYSFLEGKFLEYDINKLSSDINGGHYGGDAGIISDVIKILHSGDYSSGPINADQALAAHLIGFAADAALKESRVVNIDELLDEN